MTAEDLAALKGQITANEGRRTFVYDDATGERITKGSTVQGHPTWGIGFNVDALPFCAAAIEAQFDAVLSELVADVATALPWVPTLPSGPQRAILDIAYNAGIDGLLGFHKMLAAAQRGDFNTAANEITHSQLAPQRAARLASLMRG